MSPTFLLALCARPLLHGYALKQCRRHRDLMSADEIRSVADEGLLEACRRFDPDRGPFLVFARFWVMRQLRRALKQELRWKRAADFDELVDASEVIDELPNFECQLAMRQLERQLDSASYEVWCAHVDKGDSLRELARRYGVSIRQIRSSLSRTRARVAELCGEKPPSTPSPSPTRRRKKG